LVLKQTPASRHQACSCVGVMAYASVQRKVNAGKESHDWARQVDLAVALRRGRRLHAG
jgi:hypothetical protein